MSLLSSLQSASAAMAPSIGNNSNPALVGTAMSNSVTFPSYDPVTNKTTIQKSCNSAESGIIDRIATMVPQMFTFDTISAIFKVYEQEEFSVLNFHLFSDLMKCPLFVDYATTENGDKTRDIDAVLTLYFNGLAGGRINANPVTLKNKICTLLKMNLRVPSLKGGLTISKVTVNVSNRYKPSDTSKITASSDIANVIKQRLFQSINGSAPERYPFSPEMANVTLQGPVLTLLITQFVNLQSQFMEVSKAHGIEIEPFVENLKNKFAL